MCKKGSSIVADSVEAIDLTEEKLEFNLALG